MLMQLLTTLDISKSPLPALTRGGVLKALRHDVRRVYRYGPRASTAAQMAPAEALERVVPRVSLPLALLGLVAMNNPCSEVLLLVGIRTMQRYAPCSS